MQFECVIWEYLLCFLIHLVVLFNNLVHLDCRSRSSSEVLLALPAGLWAGWQDPLQSTGSVSLS